MPSAKQAVRVLSRKSSNSRKGSKTLKKEDQDEVTEESPPAKSQQQSQSVEHNIHQFSRSETVTFRKQLLEWYDANKRDLPWRVVDKRDSPEKRAYAVLVSEIMLQQTQVATVKQYYLKWMKRWPTFKDLAAATLEQVNEMWAGLGYYARGRRLYDAAKKIVNELDGEVPKTATKLQEELPGVGRYTAGAVASISFGERVAAVDGNVIRVLSRLRLIGGDTNSQAVTKEIWNIAEENVDLNRAGDFNQAMMELGAVMCTPKTPRCNSCPVKDLCLAYKTDRKYSETYKNEIIDIEILPSCLLCLPKSDPWNLSAGVMNLPRKAKKAAPRRQETAVAVLHRSNNDCNEYLLMKRPSEGLLANLWEFPSYILGTDGKDAWMNLKEELNEHLDIGMTDIESNSYIGNITHIFSHIRQLYIVYGVRVTGNAVVVTPEHYQEQRWVSKEQFLESAVSTGMKKIFQSFHCKDCGEMDNNRKRKRSSSKLTDGDTKKSTTITDFFTKSTKKP